jgi:hypothetical protein
MQILCRHYPGHFDSEVDGQQQRALLMHLNQEFAIVESVLLPPVRLPQMIKYLDDILLENNGRLMILIGNFGIFGE